MKSRIWPQWTRKWPLKLSSLGGCPVDFILNDIFKISSFHWSRPKFQNHLVFITFHNRIFVIFAFDKISKGMIVTVEKEPSEYFQQLHFWNQWVPLMKMQCRVRYLLDFDLKIRSGQVCREKYTKNPFETRNYLNCPLWPLAFMHHKHTQTEIWAYFWADVSVFHQRQRQSFAYLRGHP